jgi:hypothetical protein
MRLDAARIASIAARRARASKAGRYRGAGGVASAAWAIRALSLVWRSIVATALMRRAASRLTAAGLGAHLLEAGRRDRRQHRATGLVGHDLAALRLCFQQLAVAQPRDAHRVVGQVAWLSA